MLLFVASLPGILYGHCGIGARETRCKIEVHRKAIAIVNVTTFIKSMAAAHTSELRTPTSQLMSFAPAALVRNTWNVASLVAPAARLSGCAAMGSTTALQLLAWGSHRSHGVLRVFGI